MKTYEQFITEATAVAKAKFKQQFDTVRHSDAFQDTEYKRGGINKWHLTGHNPGGKYGTTKEIEAVKEKVFGKRRKGTSELLFLHHDHGIITYPAVGDITHNDVIDHLGFGKRKGIRVNKKIQAKVKEGGFGSLQGQGRIEHHEGGGGIISYSHRGVGSRAAAIRTIARAYPKYKIHDGQGNLLEAIAVAKRKKPTSKETAEFARKFNKVADSTNFSQWKLTGHNPGGKYGTSKAVEAMKEKVFGKRRKGTSDLLFLHHDHGIITHPAVGDITHSDVLAYDGPGLGIDRKPRKGIKINRKIQAKVMEGGFGGIQGQGRIEHHEGGGGIISYSHRGIGSVGAAIRTIARAYPKYKIHDGQGNLLEAEDFKSKWNRLLDSPEWQKSPRETTQWQLTGHNPGTKHGTTHEIEKAKVRVFGKRRGNTDLFWLHFHHGIVTHPAKGDIVHMDVEENRKRKGVKVDKKIQAKVAEGGIGSRWGVGRIEHHEGGGGIITYYHRGGVPKSSAVRMISREYPKYNIHDGTGNELHENCTNATTTDTRRTDQRL